MEVMRVHVIGNFYMSYNRQVVQTIADFGRLHGWALTIHKTPMHLDSKALAHADALLLGVHDLELAPAILKARMPKVGWSANHKHVPWPRVLTDSAAVGRSVARYFLTSGYRSFAFYPDLSFPWSQQRRGGFVEVLAEAGHAVEFLSYSPRRPVDHLAARLRKLPRPLALMLSYDEPMHSVIAACRKASLRIPHDVAVVGVGNDELVCDLIDPPLSSLSQPTERIGNEVAGLLDRIVKQKYVPPEITLVPPGQLVARRSSDALAFDDALVAQAMQFIRGQKDYSVAAKQVLDHLQTSRVTLDHRFKEATGTTVSGVIRQLQLQRAKQLLSDSDLPMASVAHFAGFSCGRQFSKSFHHFVGVTPTQYRQQFKVVIRPPPPLD
jgi:LacI family transcriptional regulator